MDTWEVSGSARKESLESRIIRLTSLALYSTPNSSGNFSVAGVRRVGLIAEWQANLSRRNLSSFFVANVDRSYCSSVLLHVQ